MTAVRVGGPYLAQEPAVKTRRQLASAGRLGNRDRWSRDDGFGRFGLDGDRDPAITDGNHDSVGPVTGGEAFQDLSHMVAHGTLADAELLADLPIRPSTRCVGENLQVTVGNRARGAYAVGHNGFSVRPLSSIRIGQRARTPLRGDRGRPRVQLYGPRDP